MVWLALIVAVVLSGGVLAFYRLGVGQIALARQQQDFVSSVSHELKTPLTSIRMYGEMLKSGWADEQKKESYYDFIHEESERLSRLIDNVLQLARMTRNELPLDIQPIAVGELLDIVKSRIASQVERAGFDLVVESEPAMAARPVKVDCDCFLQVVINLVDNAIKFAADAERRQIVIAARPEPAATVAITVRDFGSGIDRGQMRKIFRLFYRGENELTRETVGTGIGLALASELVRLMGGGLDVGNADPGAEFRISLPITDLS
jgi:signal transduction histidine kinase